MQRGRLIWCIILSMAIMISVMPILSLSRMLHPRSDGELFAAAEAGSWDRLMKTLRRDPGSAVLLDARGDMSARLRALGSSLAVANGIGRTLVVVWRSDADCSCRLRSLLADPMPFALLEIGTGDVPASLEEPPGDVFQVFDYVAEGKADAVVNGNGGTPSADAPKRTLVTTTPRLVVFFRSNGELMNHPFSTWLLASKHLRRLTLSAATLQPEQAGVTASAGSPASTPSSSSSLSTSTAGPTIGIHLCPSHVPMGPNFGSSELDPERVRLLVVSEEAASTTAVAKPNGSGNPRFPHTSTWPRSVRSCADARAMLEFVRASPLILFASPDEDAAAERLQACGLAGVAASGPMIAAHHDCADACCCEQACVDNKQCVAWQFYLVGVKPGRKGPLTRCYLKSTAATETAVGNWGGVLNRTLILLGKQSDREAKEEAERRGGCYASQSALRAHLAPWTLVKPPLPLELQATSMASTTGESAVVPAKLPTAAAAAIPPPQSQSSFLFWLRRTGVENKYGQDPWESKAARAAALGPGFNDSLPSRFALAALLQLAPSIENGGSHPPSVLAAVATGSWDVTVAALRASPVKYVVVDAKNGLGNRLRAIGSAMAFAQSTWRPLLVLWAKDRHCGCGVSTLFSSPLPFALLEVEVEPSAVPLDLFQIADYMDPATRNLPIPIPRTKHIYYKSGYIINQLAGAWPPAQAQLKRLVPSPAVTKLLVSNRTMVGVHVRTIFDAPLQQTTAKEKALAKTTGTRAIALANKEYGEAATKSLLLWRKASRWQNFVGKMQSLWNEETRRRQQQQAGAGATPANAPLFYVAADSQDAYEGLQRTLPPGAVVYTKRECKAERCDLRDCDALVYSLVDMLNLARTKYILGSSWSSYSEVAAYWGGNDGDPLDLFQAGKDFGEAPPRQRRRRGEVSG